MERGFQAARLPFHAAAPNLVVPVDSTWRFAGLMSRLEGIETLGLEVGLEFDGQGLAGPLWTRLLSAPTLRAGLTQFCRHCRTEGSHIRAGVTRQTDSVRFWHLGPFDDHPGLRQMELYFVMALLKIVRTFVGPRWQPPVIGLQSSSMSRRANEIFPNTRFLLGQPTHFIQIPRTLLCEPPREAAPAYGRSDSGAGELPTEFAAVLRLLLQSYLPDGNVTLDMAAELTGVSRRTLQRRLAAMDLSFSQLLDQTRYELAARLLSEPSVKVIDVAFESGYGDPSHFARAFRRIAGVSPSHYRRLAIESAG